ncbi:MAG TPA: Hsp20/alpha crystallin family protein [Albitalea sp.]|nr:Hsp20/alpha crystallin family protein [Albitalea sp.]
MASRFPLPYSSSRELRSFDPLMELHREMNRLFDNLLSGPSGSAAGSEGGMMTMPRIDVHEDERELCISAELPGVKPSEVDIRVEGDVLTISGEKKTETERKEENYHLMERGYGRFRRSVQLPFAPDPEQVRADCNHGVLTIHMPRQPQQERSRRIEVRETGSGDGQQAQISSGGGAQTQPGQQAGTQAGTQAGGTSTH